MTDLRRYDPLKLLVLALAAFYVGRFVLFPSVILHAFLHWPLLVFHEAGHLLMAPLGQLMALLGGSFWQVAVPLALVLYFALTRQLFSAALLLFLLAFSLLDVSVYAADAQARALPLITFDPDTHDWWQILGRLELLSYDRVVATGFYLEGLACYLLACWLGLGTATRKLGGSEPDS